MASGRDRARSMPFLLVLLAIALVAAGGIFWVLSPNWGGRLDGADRNVGALGGAPWADVVLPRSITIPRLHERAPVVAVRTDRYRELQIPQDPKTVGWWTGGARPGAPRGTAVLAGHINYEGVQGALGNIGKLNPGDRFTIRGVRGGKDVRVHFRVTAIRTYSKARLPYDRIFDQRSAGRLALVTCGGAFDASTGNYEDNVVAYAVVARARHGMRRTGRHATHGHT